MPKRTDIKTILIIGAGPIIIGQACEFDYSGTQACKTLKAEGYRIVLVNSNPATIMTDPDLADATYVEPITPEIVAKIIEKERNVLPGGFALLPTMGGQTALNCALSLQKMGVLEKFDVEMIGATADAIDKAEDRERFREAMTKIGLSTPRSHHVKTLGAALDALEDIGLPAIIRPSFTMGGTGGGIAYNKGEFIDIVERGMDASPTSEVLIEESVLGWKEYEMEVVRDKADNCIIVCSIENIDPMGVHTGDSITVAPALTLTDKEYQIMRDASLAVLREIGVETGGSNVQFAVDPESGRMIVIEMNPRVSRSSALASKATGFPIAKVAARLAVGYTLDEIENDITGGATPASFEPTIDYVVTKIPRFAFEKFPGSEPTLTTAMKSVGEAMAIGRTFQESLQKALRSLETGLDGLDEIEIEGVGHGDDKNAIKAALSTPTPDRILQVAQAMRAGFTDEQIHESCKIDPWFLEQMRGIVDAEEKIRKHGLPQTPIAFRQLKAMGFSDKRLAAVAGKSEDEVRTLRRSLKVRPVFKRIDTCAAEFASPTAYMYSTYAMPFAGAPADEAQPSDRKKVVILGGGPNRIGQGIEFDYCCCHACYALRDAGYETIMVNCNPETVSTDYDTSDRLYFEPLTAEDVLEILETEKQNGTLHGVIVQFGGQTPLKLAHALEQAGIPILGTTPDAIDLAEDRDRFKRLLDKLQLKQPKNGIAYSVEQSRMIAAELGLPFVVRPSYVLGGRAMAIIRDEVMFEDYLLGTLPSLIPSEVKAKYPNDKTGQINTVLGKNPLLFDRYLSDAIEVDVDCLCDGKDAFIAGIMEHIEEAGIHSGDSACSLPPRSLSPELIAELERQSKAMALALDVGGLMNVQYAIKDGDIYVLEVNPRASRTVPFVAKVIGQPIAKIAARLMAGEKLASFNLKQEKLDHVGVKEAVFPFARFPGVDVLLGPEMRSTGEVIGLDRSFDVAFAKSQLGAGSKVPIKGTVFVSVRDEDKPRILPAMAMLAELGFQVVATGGTLRLLQEHGIRASKINKVLEGRPHVVDAIKNGEIQLVFNTTDGPQALADSRSLRRAALLHKVPYYTTLAGAIAAAEGIKAYCSGDLEVRSLQSYFARAA
ncbi:MULTISPECIES: carbamoyl-phosphate synthase large subunit [unclassified Bosea (in: a-proteobacteria)]|uniref:carbamoyl-phosphate synthase large subunit n=1 Tax=unclassified Bosea (in: a-proteobacteria) TaxID=2653178 RepID=UPI000F74D63C|nr:MULTISPECIES: carbamoyl-phosphate synthase large subunit [unclassified Bosea (in: a-proteobacteria)]AZO81132.1 carbamoyl phosphate synthase large subunit [Bosea sp. Tri-49]RXT26525.1 carbamoyl phosphate synthase large subunit [Bosea sp. Tri-39]RXT33126.1 carbamoyl phosphate synthase large subunit [Bosea sp. Tri-54]